VELSFAETPPWTGMSAMEIKAEIVDLGRGLDSVESRPVSDPFIMLLQYGLSSRINDRRLSLEQMRDILTEHIMVYNSERFVCNLYICLYRGRARISLRFHEALTDGYINIGIYKQSSETLLASILDTVR
jgi:hypothetical protein